MFTGDFTLTEVLQGFVSERDFNQARKLLASVPLVPLVGEEIAFQAARNFRKLRSLGITIRKTIDTLIAKRTIQYSDQRPIPPLLFAGQRGRRTWRSWTITEGSEDV